MALELRPLILAILGIAGLPAHGTGQSDSSTTMPEHGLKIQQKYDAARDATTVTLILDKGRHFIRWHRPRVTAVFQYRGRTPSARPDSVLVEFRTQSPQYTSTNVLTLTTSGGARLAVAATRSRVYYRVQTTDHTLTFALATADLEPLLLALDGEMEVGGVRVRLKRRHFLGLAALLQRVTPEEHTFTPSNQRMHPTWRGHGLAAD
jgi:hypothetical protein